MQAFIKLTVHFASLNCFCQSTILLLRFFPLLGLCPVARIIYAGKVNKYHFSVQMFWIF